MTKLCINGEQCGSDCSLFQDIQTCYWINYGKPLTTSMVTDGQPISE